MTPRLRTVLERLARYRQLLLVIAFLAIVFATAELSGLREHFSLTTLHDMLVRHQFIGLGIFVLLFSLGNLIQIPGWIFLGAAVLALGRVWGGLATYTAAVVSCAVTFHAIRFIGGDALRRLDSKIAQRLLAQLDAHPVRSIVVLRMLFQTLPALNYALALSGVGFRRYLLGTLIGLPLPIAVYCLLFDYLGMLIPRG